MSPSSFLSLQLSLASLLACLSLPSPVTLEGFNHQLNVTPYLRSADEHSRTHKHMYAASLLVGDLTLSATFFFPASNLKGTLDKMGRPPTCKLLSSVCACSAYNLDKVWDKHIRISECGATGAATVTGVRMSGSEVPSRCFTCIFKTTQAGSSAAGEQKD